MRTLHRKRTGGSRKRGFTLIEVVIAASIMGVIGLGLTQGLQLANQTNDTVRDRSTQNREVRKALSMLRSELRSTRSDLLAIQADAVGNHQVTFQVPVDGPGSDNWGVYDARIGTTPTTQNRLDWSLRYSVLPAVDGSRTLVREILDDTGVVQNQRTLASNLLLDNDPDGPSFRVQSVGDIWEVSLTTKQEQSDGARIDTFHVRLRN